MSTAPAQFWADWRRNGRLLRRHLRYGRTSFSAHPSAARTAALTVLFHVVNGWLRDSGAEYALAYGTLLGWHREGGLLAHDRDVDFAAPLAMYARLRDAGARLPAGFILRDTSHRHHGPKLYVDHDGWDADIYFFRDVDGGRLQSTERSGNPGETTPFPRDWLFPLQRAEFLGEPTCVPAQPVALLTHHYQYLGTDAVRDPVTRYFRPRDARG